MQPAHLDFETRSELDLPKVGLARYVTHPSTAAWCASYRFGKGPVLRWRIGEPPPFDLLAHVAEGGEVWAHNAPFEYAIWHMLGWPTFPLEQLHCTMAAAYAMALPGTLEDAAMALGLPVQKDKEGRALMLRMARPRSLNPTVWWDDAERLERLQQYCDTDVLVESALHERVLPLSPTERRVWLMDQRINMRGFAVDLTTAAAGSKIADVLAERYDAQLSELTGGAATAITAVGAIKKWAAEAWPEGWTGEGDKRVHRCESLDKAAIVDLLARTDVPDTVRKVLALRQEAGLTSLSKLDNMRQRAHSGRIHGSFQYHGAGTGRWAGRGLQPHNFVRDMPTPERVEQILQHVRDGDADSIDMWFGPPASMVARCMRAFIVPAPGSVLVGGDYSGIEGRGTAWVAKEQWKLDAFVASDNKTGPGIYELAYAKAFNVPVESVKNPSNERQIGKVMELAFGYEGGKGAWHTMGKAYGVRSTDEQADEYKRGWRSAHPKIVAKWKELKNAAIAACRSPGQTIECWPVKFKVVGSFLWCLLPSGRALCYPYPKLLPGEYGDAVTYMTVPNPAKPEKIIKDAANHSGWARVSTYGGMLMENIVQAICRDILAEAMLRCEAAGFSLVLHVHDEAVAEESTDRSEEMTQLMRIVPTWATGFPIKIKCSAVSRYGYGK